MQTTTGQKHHQMLILKGQRGLQRSKWMGAVIQHSDLTSSLRCFSMIRAHQCGLTRCQPSSLEPFCISGEDLVPTATDGAMMGFFPSTHAVSTLLQNGTLCHHGCKLGSLSVCWTHSVCAKKELLADDGTDTFRCKLAECIWSLYNSSPFQGLGLVPIHRQHNGVQIH